MPIQSVDYIITAEHYDKQKGGPGDAVDWINKCREKITRERGIKIEIKGLNPLETRGLSVMARIWQGQWIADCECGGASFVSPKKPVFFCFGCANRGNDGWLRSVIFPQDTERAEIEKLVLSRPVDDMAGLNDLERAGLARPILFQELPDGSTRGLSRNWEPGETLADLQEQNKTVEKWRKELRRKGRK